MDEIKRKERNRQRLAELYPAFRIRIEAVIADLENLQLRPRIQEAWRSPEDQLKAYESGHSQLKYGFHNVIAKDGTPEALAVDLLDDDAPLNPKRPYLLHLAAAAQKHGLETGIRWGVPVELVKGIDNAIAQQAWDAHVKIGWDPTHVQPTGIKVSDTGPPKYARPT